MISTRGGQLTSIDEAILKGLSCDGGLFVPEEFPEYRIDDFFDCNHHVDFAQKLLHPYFSDSRVTLDDRFCAEVFSFPLVIKDLAKNSYVLELFHGPTLSFKDFGARFFAQCLQVLMQGKKTKVIVATSGDTGSAVASALYDKKNISGIVLFPKGKISQRQEAQITCWGKNIHALAVNGTFDQCQQLVKRAFGTDLQEHEVLTTANSINIARLLPQILFYAYSSIQLAKQHDDLINYIVPCGNLGNVTACYWAKKSGFPIGTILIANNENAVLSDFLNTGIYRPKQSIATLANAMDVGDPSNLERLRVLFGSFDEFRNNVDALSVHDREIEEAIVDCYTRYGYLICPHTATAYHRFAEVDKSKPWVITSTAHPAKFEEVIEPLLNIKITVPEQLRTLLSKRPHVEDLEVDFQAFQAILNLV